jgi:hypothetical protein
MLDEFGRIVKARQMGVAVDQAGDDHFAGGIDHLGSRADHAGVVLAGIGDPSIAATTDCRSSSSPV